LLDMSGGKRKKAACAGTIQLKPQMNTDFTDGMERLDVIC
jgi:hypothetical protein